MTEARRLKNDVIFIQTILKNSVIYKFGDDNTISVASKTRDTLLETLENESELAVNWFRNNNMILNPDKFQLMLLEISTKKVIQEKLQIDNNEIKAENSVTLVGILLTIGYHLMTKVTKHMLKSIDATKCYIQTEEILEAKTVGNCS